jgi:hypothetical protein
VGSGCRRSHLCDPIGPGAGASSQGEIRGASAVSALTWPGVGASLLTVIRASRVILGCWLASIVSCDRESPVDADSSAPAGQPSAEVPVERTAQADAAADPRASAKSQQSAVHAPEDPEAARRAAEAKIPDAPDRTHGGAPEPTRGPAGTTAASGTASGSASSSAGATPTDPLLMSVEPPSPTLLIVSAPPTVYTLTSEAPITQGPKPTLVQRSVKRNAIIDEDKWLERNGLEFPTWDRPARTGSGGHPFAHLRPPGAPPLPPFPPAPPPRNPLPPEIPVALAGAHIATAIRSTPFSIAIYPVGSFELHGVVVRDATGKLLGALDLSAYAHVPGDTGHSRQDVRWAQVQDGVLFVSTFHMGYASDSGGLNAFITALDLATGELLWRSEPLVSNSSNFLLRDGWIITGYGFTAEPDFLFVLDGKTGEVAQRMKVKSGPEMILEKDGIIYVRTYDRDYEVVAKTK